MKKLCMINEHGKNDISYYAVMMKDADYEAIEQILEKYVNAGYSCRGTADEVFADMKDVMLNEQTAVNITGGKAVYAWRLIAAQDPEIMADICGISVEEAEALIKEAQE